MIRIRFADDDAKRRALGFLAGRFRFKSWATGEMLLPQHALAALSREGISFTVEGPVTYEQAVLSRPEDPTAHQLRETTRREAASALVSGLGSSVLGALLAWYLVEEASVWLAGLVALICGAAGGALGQHLIEGIVVAVMSLGMLALLILSPLPPLWQELGVGLSVGNALGWVCHGLFTDR